jgi:hypothetical protein
MMLVAPRQFRVRCRSHYSERIDAFAHSYSLFNQEEVSSARSYYRFVFATFVTQLAELMA